MASKIFIHRSIHCQHLPIYNASLILILLTKKNFYISSSIYLGSLFLQSIETISMAFIASPSIIRNSISWKNMIVCDMADNTCRDKFLFPNKGIYKGKHNLRDNLSVTNVVSPSRVISPPPPPEKQSGTTDGRQHHVAWTSVSQERWEGELLVQGHIPLWLVGIFFFFYQHSYFSSSNSCIFKCLFMGVVLFYFCLQWSW